MFNHVDLMLSVMGIGVEMGTVCLIDFVSDLFVICL